MESALEGNLRDLEEKRKRRKRYILWDHSIISNPLYSPHIQQRLFHCSTGLLFAHFRDEMLLYLLTFTFSSFKKNVFYILHMYNTCYIKFVLIGEFLHSFVFRTEEKVGIYRNNMLYAGLWSYSTYNKLNETFIIYSILIDTLSFTIAMKRFIRINISEVIPSSSLDLTKSSELSFY